MTPREVIIKATVDHMIMIDLLMNTRENTKDQDILIMTIERDQVVMKEGIMTVIVRETLTDIFNARSMLLCILM